MSATPREGLEGQIDRYLGALSAQEPSLLSLAAGCRFTENGEELSLGQGLWLTARAREPGGQYFTDSEAGQVAFFGAVADSDKKSLVSVRLKVEDGLIAEIETTRVPQGGFMFEPESVCGPRPAFEEALVASQRRPRGEMIRIANLYFEGIEHNNGDIIPLGPDVFRIENGVRTANSKDEPSADEGPLVQAVRKGVAQQLNDGHFEYIAAIRDRRFLVVDEERGMVFGMFFFDHPGNEGAEGGDQPASSIRISRSTAIIAEAFKIKDGLIQQVEAIGTLLPYGARPGWD
jgi:hypothetical protein